MLPGRRIDATASLAVLASDDVPVGTVSQVFPYRDAHGVACKLGPIQATPTEP